MDVISMRMTSILPNENNVCSPTPLQRIETLPSLFNCCRIEPRQQSPDISKEPLGDPFGMDFDKYISNEEYAIPGEAFDPSFEDDVQLFADSTLSNSVEEFFDKSRFDFGQLDKKRQCIVDLKALARQCSRALTKQHGLNVSFKFDKEFGSTKVWPDHGPRARLDFSFNLSVVGDMGKDFAKSALSTFSNVLESCPIFTVADEILDAKTPCLKVMYHDLELHISLSSRTRKEIESYSLLKKFCDEKSVSMAVYFLREILKDRGLTDAFDGFPNVFTITNLILWGLVRLFGRENEKYKGWSAGEVLIRLIQILQKSDVSKFYRRGINVGKGHTFFTTWPKIRLIFEDFGESMVVCDHVEKHKWKLIFETLKMLERKFIESKMPTADFLVLSKLRLKQQNQAPYQSKMRKKQRSMYGASSNDILEFVDEDDLFS